MVMAVMMVPMVVVMVMGMVMVMVNLIMSVVHLHPQSPFSLHLLSHAAHSFSMNPFKLAGFRA